MHISGDYNPGEMLSPLDDRRDQMETFVKGAVAPLRGFALDKCLHPVKRGIQEG